MVKPSKSKLIGRGIVPPEREIANIPQIRQPVKMKDLGNLPDGLVRGELDENIKIFGAAGTIETPKKNLQTMSDPHDKPTREAFTNCAYQDPFVSPGLDRRNEAFFEDGYILTLGLKSMYDETTGDELTPEEVQVKLAPLKQEYLGHLQKIRDWESALDIESQMDESNISGLVQGRGCTLIVPGFLELAKNALPVAVEIVNWQDLGEPIIDVGYSHKLVGVFSEFPNKKVIRADEMIYVVRKAWGLRKESSKYGASILEPIAEITKTIKRIYHFDIPEAIVASYITKLLFKFSGLQGLSDEQIQDKIETFLDSFYTTGQLAFGMTDTVEAVTPATNNVDSAMLDTNEKKLVDTEMSVVGTPKSMLNREQNLNRDLAIIEMIQFMKFVRKPDEKIIAKAFEDQLFNPLLAHLAGKEFKQIPVRIIIKSRTKEPDYNLMEDKQTEAANETIEGASSGAPLKWTVIKGEDEYVVTRGNNDS